MGQKKKDRNHDKFYQLAKEQGFRSRASFKLIQLNRKYDFLSGARACLDLCAAPGGWMQVAVKTMPVGSFILGVDLQPIKAVRGARTLVGDITSPQTLSAIRHESGNIEFDVVICDGSPNVGGAWIHEAYTQILLTLEGIKIATKLLKPGGIFVAKVFRSRDYTTLLYVMNQLFGRVEATKPQASRYQSAEIFVVCMDYKAPKKIDPKLLDPNHVFQDVTEAPRPMGPDALLRQVNKKRRNREGYEDGLSTVSKVMSAVGFVAAQYPGDVLGRYTKISLEKGDEKQTEETEGMDIQAIGERIRQHQSTTEEIREYCRDLQILGKSEYRRLLAWHRTLRKECRDLMKVQGEDGENKNDEEFMTPQEKREAALLKELEELKMKIDRKTRRHKKKRREMKKRTKIRAAQFSAQEGIGEDINPEGERMFSLLKVTEGTQVVQEADVPEDEDFEEELEEEDDSQQEESDEDYDEDADQRKYDALMEEYLEHSYKTYLDKKGIKQSTQRKKKRKRIGEDEDMELEEEQLLPEKEGKDDLSEIDEDANVLPEPKHKANELIVKFDESKAGVPRTARAVTAHWFAQDIFKDEGLMKIEKQQKNQNQNGIIVEEDEAGQDGHGNQFQEVDNSTADKNQSQKNVEEKVQNQNGLVEDSELLVAKTKKKRKVSFQAGQNGVTFEDDDDEQKQEQDGGIGMSGLNKAAKELRQQHNILEKGKDFDVVKNSDDEGMTDSEDEFTALDDDAKAEILAMAKKMLRGRAKTDILEAAYNRYVFHDDELPTWFSQDENRHMRPDPLVTKEEIEAEKARLRAIDARPIKKVAEAKARKKKRLKNRLDKAKKKAEEVADQEDMPMGSKMREISKIYKKARKEGGFKKLSKMTRKERRKFLGKQKPMDRRMRSDLRGQKWAEAKLKSSKKGTKAGRGKAKAGSGRGRGRGRGR